MICAWRETTDTLLTVLKWFLYLSRPTRADLTDSRARSKSMVRAWTLTISSAHLGRCSKMRAKALLVTTFSWRKRICLCRSMFPWSKEKLAVLSSTTSSSLKALVYLRNSWAQESKSKTKKITRVRFLVAFLIAFQSTRVSLLILATSGHVFKACFGQVDQVDLPKPWIFCLSFCRTSERFIQFSKNCSSFPGVEVILDVLYANLAFLVRFLPLLSWSSLG